MIISVRKWLVPGGILLFLFCLVIFSSSNLSAARDGLVLWANHVVPTLLPFLIATELLARTPFVPFLGRLCNRWMRPLFHVPGEGAFALLMGIISGYPVGAKIVTNLYNHGHCTKEEANRMLGFTNNSGPLFMIGTVGVSLFCNAQIGFLLFLTHVLAGILVGILTGWISCFSKKEETTSPTTFSPSTVRSSSSFPIGECIQNAIQTMLMIGGFVMLFSVLLSMLSRSHVLPFLGLLLSPLLELLSVDSSFAVPILSGILELTNGVQLLSSISYATLSVNITCCAFVLGFGGLSVALQVYGIIANSGLSIGAYLRAKFLQGILAAVFTYGAMHYFRFWNWDVQSVFAPASQQIPVFSSGEVEFLTALLLMIALCVIGLFCGKNKSVRH